jgi:hypothetical protein
VRADINSIIRADGRYPNIFDHREIGDTLGPLMIATDGRHAAAPVVRRSSAAHASLGYTPTTGFALLANPDQNV